MSRIVYLNGEYLPEEEAKISIFDRSVLFGDAIYEVAGVSKGKLLNFDSHYNRLINSLKKLSIPTPLTQEKVLAAYRILIAKNHIVEGLIYMQVTRGEDDRDFLYAKNMKPNVFMFSQIKPKMERTQIETGVKLKSVEDIRWARRDIKSTNLLGQVLAKQTAKQAGAYEALLIDKDGFITECASSSFFILKKNRIITRPLSSSILPGVTRETLIHLCNQHGFKLQERLFTLKDALTAKEAFISGASTHILGVSHIDDQKIGFGKPGPVSKQLREICIAHILTTSI